MQGMETTVNVKDLKKGDVFNPEGSGWIATADAYVSSTHQGKGIIVPVQFIPDGGFGERVWRVDQNQMLTVQR